MDSVENVELDFVIQALVITFINGYTNDLLEYLFISNKLLMTPETGGQTINPQGHNSRKQMHL